MRPPLTIISLILYSTLRNLFHYLTLISLYIDSIRSYLNTRYGFLIEGDTTRDPRTSTSRSSSRTTWTVVIQLNTRTESPLDQQNSIFKFGTVNSQTTGTRRCIEPQLQSLGNGVIMNEDIRYN